MKLHSIAFIRAAVLSSSVHFLCASAHTYVWSVWVNGVDQGTGNGIRLPAYNGPAALINGGFANGPVRDLTKPELACNVLGEVPNNATIEVAPGDTVTVEWHHDYRTAEDDIIATSHKGAGLVYLSPDPPVGESWVKIQEEAEDPPGQWYTGDKLNERKGMQDVVIPEGLAPGFYLLRAELLTLHEADVSHVANNHRGIQIYISCVQLQVTGNGNVTLPAGVAFPGAYQYTDPGIVYNIYLSTAGQQYTIPGPAVWTAAAASPSPPAYGQPIGYTTAQPWYTWIGSGFSDVTLATSLTVGTGTQTAVYAYTPSWSTAHRVPSAAIASFAASYRMPAEVPQITAPPEA